MLKHRFSLPGITLFPLVGKEGDRKFELGVDIGIGIGIGDSGRLLHLFFSCFHYKRPVIFVAKIKNFKLEGG